MPASAYLRNICADEATDRTISLRLHSGAPGKNGTANRIGTYTQSVSAASWTTASGGASTLSVAVAFGAISGGVTISHITLWDGSNFLDTARLPASVSVPNGSSYTLAANAITMQSNALKRFIKPVRQSARDFDFDSGNSGSRAIATDGSTIWVADVDGQAYAYSIPASGAPTRDSSRDFDLAGVLRNGITTDGYTIWVADAFVDKAYAYSIPASGAPTRDSSRDFDFASANGTAVGITTDGSTIWVADAADEAYAYSIPATGAPTRDSSRDFDFASANRGSVGITTDGSTIWVADVDDDEAYAYSIPATGAPTRDSSRDFDFASGNGDAAGIATDGSTIWVADGAAAEAYAYRSVAA